jgi:uncharacterized protein (DUF2384 family)
MQHIGPAYRNSDKTPEQRERIKIAEDAAASIFGNSNAAGAWMFTYTPNVAGGTLWPVQAAETADGLAEVLAELERLRPLTEPKPLPISLQRQKKR